MTMPDPDNQVVIEYSHRESDGEFWLDIKVDGKLWAQLEFDTPEERLRAHDELLDTLRSTGAVDLPLRVQ